MLAEAVEAASGLNWVQIASTAGSVVVVVLFLQAWSKDRERQKEVEQTRSESLKEIGKTCHDHSTRREEILIGVIQQHAAVIADATVTIRNLSPK